jgi:hypothetical protein
MLPTLALDTSKRRTGYFADLSDGRRVSGSYTGASEALPGRAGALYSQWLCQIISTYKPALIAYEAPVIGNRGGGMTMNMEVAFVLIGLAFLTETIAASYKIRCVRAHAMTVRKHFLGTGRPENPKRAVMERCKLLGFDVANHDVADAAALWAWAKATHDKEFRYETTTPLFGKAGAA